MRMRTLMSASVVALSMIAAPAMAQDSDREFDGVYVGGSFGYTVQNNDVNEIIEFDAGRTGDFGDTILDGAGDNYFAPGFCNGAATSTANLACANDKDDIEYYGRIGLDKQMGKFVVGAVAEFGKSNARDSVTAFSADSDIYQLSRKMDWNAALRLRAGLVAGQKTLFYATGGGAYGKFDNSFRTTNTTNSFELSGDDKAWGWQAGGGVEQKFGKSFSIGLEYLYSKYDDSDTMVSVGTGTAGAGNAFVLNNGVDFRRTEKFDTHALRATAQFRF